MAFFTLLLAGGLLTYTYTIGGDSTVGSTTKMIVERIKGKLEFLNLDELPVAKKFAKFTGKDTSEQDAWDHLELRDACLNSMFVEKSGDHFSQSQWGAKPIPYQFRGLEVTGPDPVALNETDEANGIDKRVFFTIKVESYRSFEGEGWSEWKFEQPPKLDGLTLIRQKGLWKVASGANKAYAVK